MFSVAETVQRQMLGRYELERISKEAVSQNLKHHTDICLKKLKTPTKSSVRTFGLRTRISYRNHLTMKQG